MLICLKVNKVVKVNQHEVNDLVSDHHESVDKPAHIIQHIEDGENSPNMGSSCTTDWTDVKSPNLHSTRNVQNCDYLILCDSVIRRI